MNVNDGDDEGFWDDALFAPGGFLEMPLDFEDLLDQQQEHVGGAVAVAAAVAMNGIEEQQVENINQNLIFMEDYDPALFVEDPENINVIPPHVPANLHRFLERLFAKEVVTTKQRTILCHLGHQYYKEKTNKKPNRDGRYFCSWSCKTSGCRGRATSYR